MKKIILLLLLMAVTPLLNAVRSQCVVKNVIVQVNYSNSNPTNDTCTINFDFIFTIENNGGNKWIYIHSWMANEYPNYFNCPNVPSNAKAPVAGDLVLSKINLGIHNEVHVGHPVPTLLTTYPPDVTVPINQANSLVRQVYPTGDSARFTVKGVTIKVPKACSDVISMKADFWSSQAQNATVVHCVACNVGFTIDPRVSGLINCGANNEPRTFNMQIRSVAPFSISGQYSVYMDYAYNGMFGTFGDEDVMVYTNTYVTTVEPGTNPLVNLFAVSNVGYPPYNSQIPDANRNLWVLVTTNGYTNKALGYLYNSCSPLPIKLQDFHVRLQSDVVNLSWVAEQQGVFEGYEIQRKAGNGIYEKIAFVPASAKIHALNGLVTYNYIDRMIPENTDLFYRLRAIEMNGQSFYSDIHAVAVKSILVLTVYPNPSRGITYLMLSEQNGAMDVSLDDFSGKTIRKWSNVAVQNLELRNLLPGIYMVRIYIRSTGEQYITKFVVQ